MDAGLTGALYLVKNGVPFDVALSLSPADVLAFSIIFGQMDGGEWDWGRMTWRERK
ncbi:MAG: hypothetical protein M0006_05340 [Magnetospirillum sp.]|nr:hypothetical protein [Magnetospirillum sp.]